MKKTLKNLEIKKEVVSELKMKNVKGGGHCATFGSYTTCAPPGAQCF